MIRPPPATPAAADVRISGVVQGVGFRPFLHRLALRHGLNGFVRNDSGGVEARLEGPDAAIDAFLTEMAAEAPPLARIDALRAVPAVPRGETSFRVLESRPSAGERLPVSPDVSTCDSCLVELSDPLDRRFGYPFITCTDCGPRYSVTLRMPYDRDRTTMRPFRMCPACDEEYSTASDRRYHSETNSCPDCGPRFWLEPTASVDAPIRVSTQTDDEHPLAAAADRLREGAIVAVKGVGGFHLAVDATNEAAVRRLRRRKARDEKPFAMLVSSLDAAARLAEVSPAAAGQLDAPERPIVVLPRRELARLAPGVSPGLSTVGIMLPSAPHQALLATAVGRPLVFTSGNLSNEPLVADNRDARESLSDIADWFLFHDRDISARIDDSVVRVVEGRPVFLRRARGYAPLPLRAPVAAPVPLLAVGGHLKSTFALMDADQVFMSPHLGNLESLETLEHFEDTLARFRELFGIEPEAVARDLHPAYLSTKWADELGVGPIVPVQHHHAHIAAIAAEHGVLEPVLGVAYDGTGFGEDGCVWGAEFLLSAPTGYRRLAHLRYAPLPGGDLAARQPWRAAAGYLSLAEDGESGAAFAGVSRRERQVVERQIRRRLNAPLWSSMGRLFDAAAAIIGVRGSSTYEGQAAMELESLAGTVEADPLPLPWTESDGMRILDPLPLLRRLASGVRRGQEPSELAAGFHEGVARATADLVLELSRERRIDRVALGGGVFQNARLLESTSRRLEHMGLDVLHPRSLSPNDGSISYGQAVIAAARLRAAERS